MSLPTPYYDDGRITLYCGDCREILPQMEPGSADLVLTDPPYGHQNNSDGDLIHRREYALGHSPIGVSDPRPIANDGPEANDLVRWMFCEANRLLKPGCCCCCCCGGGGPDPQFARWSLWLDEAIGFKQMVIWHKGGMGMGWHYRRDYETVLVGEKPGAAGKWYGGNSISNVIKTRRPIPQATDHPTPKPIDLMAAFIAWHTVPGDLVLDPFAGHGPVLVAAKRLGRRSVGVEIDEAFCAATVARLLQQSLPLYESEEEAGEAVYTNGVLEI